MGATSTQKGEQNMYTAKIKFNINLNGEIREISKSLLSETNDIEDIKKRIAAGTTQYSDLEVEFRLIGFAD